MSIEVNSVWSVSDIDGVGSGLFRVIAILTDIHSFVLFELLDRNALKRPIIYLQSDFEDGIKSKKIEPSGFSLPDYLLVNEDYIPDKYKIIRDQRYRLIENLIENENILFDLATQKRVRFLSEHAKLMKVKVESIYRNLNLYWRFGQNKSALLPAYKNSGGPGKIRVAGDIKRGAPKVSKTGAFDFSQGKNITERDKDNVSEGLKKYYFNIPNATLKDAHEDIKSEYYSEIIEKSAIEHSAAMIPSYGQLVYWKKKLFTQDYAIKKRTTEGDYLRNKRAVFGSATENTPVPGSCFEIDATVADVHVVSDFRRNHVIGRPTIYSVVDKASRMIVGFHVSMEYASWSAARQALINCFLHKPAYCARYGIAIFDADWPCHHIPQQLLCDRGEMICSKPRELVVPLMQLNIAPPYRADFKGIVERTFGLLNDNLLHKLLGTTNGKQTIRGDKDPRKRAMHTLNEITAMLIDEVLKHNRTTYDELAISSRLLIEYDLDPTPLNFWNIHLAKHMHSLKMADELEVRAKLLPSIEVSMTKNGILFEGMYYSCERIKIENWGASARVDGRWRMEARIDQDNTTFIYVRLKDNEGFTKCKILKRSDMFIDLTLADVYYFQDWSKSKAETQSTTHESIPARNRKKEIERNAKKEMANAPPLVSSSEKVADMKNRRRQAIQDEKQSRQIDEADVTPVQQVECQKPSIILDNKRSRIIPLLKRKMEDEK